MVPQLKRSDASNWVMWRKKKHFPLSEKVNILDLIRKEKKSYIEVTKIYGKNESSIVKKEKEIGASFLVTSQTIKVIATVHKNLVKMEKALNFVCMHRKNLSMDRVQNYLQFQASTRGLGTGDKTDFPVA